MTDIDLLVALAIPMWIVGFAVLAGHLAQTRRRTVALWGIFGGILGPVAAVLLITAPMGTCGSCGSRVNGWSDWCKECGRDVRTGALRPNAPPALGMVAAAPVREVPPPVLDTVAHRSIREIAPAPPLALAGPDDTTPPADAAETPADVPAPSADITEHPFALVVEPRADASESQADVTETPADVTETPADVTQPPADVTETPADVTETPADVTETPVALAAEPPVARRRTPRSAPTEPPTTEDVAPAEVELAPVAEVELAPVAEVPPPASTRRRTRRPRRTPDVEPDPVVMVLGMGVYVTGSVALQPGSRYAIEISGGTLRVRGPVDVQPMTVALERRLDRLQAASVNGRLIIDDRNRTSTNTLLVFMSMGPNGTERPAAVINEAAEDARERAS